MNFSDIARPGVMIAQVSPQARKTEGQTVAILEKVIRHGWFSAVHSPEIHSPAERRDFASIVRENGLQHTSCLAIIQYDRNLNLSDLDENSRRASVDAILCELEGSVEAGADTIQLIGGAQPTDPQHRGEALKALQRSLAEISARAAEISSLRIAIEPLDYFAHKKHALGSTEEAIQMCEQTKAEGLDLYICFDTAHTLLNGERPDEALRRCLPHVTEYHLCNCVTSPDAPLYGDFHMPFGKPGAIDATAAGALLRDAQAIGFLNASRRPTIFCEVMNTTEREPAEMIREQQAFLEEAWQAGQ